MTTYHQGEHDQAYERPSEDPRGPETGNDALARWGVASADRTEVAPSYDDRETYREEEPYVEPTQEERFGGVNWGAGFFGWLVAVGMAALLTGVLGAAAAVVSQTLPEVWARLEGDPRTTSLVAAAALVFVLMTAYYAGGYVAGRMSRFDGGRQGTGVWLTGLLLTALAVGLGLVFGTEYNILDRVNLPSLPVPTGAVGIGGVITAVAALLGSLLAAIGGGKVGCRYHRKVDAYGVEDGGSARW